MPELSLIAATRMDRVPIRWNHLGSPCPKLTYNGCLTCAHLTHSPFGATRHSTLNERWRTVVQHHRQGKGRKDAA